MIDCVFSRMILVLFDVSDDNGAMCVLISCVAWFNRSGWARLSKEDKETRVQTKNVSRQKYYP